MRKLEELKTKIPDQFFCKITREIMMDPVSTKTGQTYERSAILQHFASRIAENLPLTDPNTNIKLETDSLTPNWSLKSLISDWLKKHPQCTDQKFIEVICTPGDVNEKIAEVERLIFLGANVNARDQGGSTPLHWAAFNENKSLIELLLKNGADLEATDNNRESPLLETIRLNVGTQKYEIIKILLEKGAILQCRYKDGMTPLHLAVASNQLEITQLLLQYKADVNVATEDESLSIREQELKEQEEAISKRDNEPISKTPEHSYHLRFQSEKAQIKALKEKLNKEKAELQKLMKDPKNDGQTPLHIAVDNRREDITNLLLEKGADTEIKNNNGETPLHRAAVNCSKNITQLLLTCNANVNAITKTGATPLAYIAYSNLSNDKIEDLIKIAELLLAYEADTEITDENGWTALHRAAYQGNKEIIALLLDYGANYEAQTHNGRSPKQVATENNKPEIAKFIDQKVTDLKQQMRTLPRTIKQHERHIEQMQQQIDLLTAQVAALNLAIQKQKLPETTLSQTQLIMQQNPPYQSQSNQNPQAERNTEARTPNSTLGNAS